MTRAALLLLVFAVAWAQDPPAETRPVMVNNAFVDPFSGKGRGSVQEGDPFSAATPLAGKPGCFEIYPRRDAAIRLRVDTSTRNVVENDAPYVVFADRTLLFFKSARKKAWQAELPARGGSVRPPDSLILEREVIAAHDGGVAAYSVADGTRLWDSPGIADRLCRFKDLVLAGDCSTRKEGEHRLVVARRLSDGGAAWKLELPGREEIADITLVGRHALVREGSGTSAAPLTLLLDDQGAALMRLEEFVHRAVPNNGGWLLITSTRYARILAGGKTAWEKALPAGAKGDFDSMDVVLSDDTAFVWQWGGISDSGVIVRRLHPMTGEIAWSASCASLSLEHSKYWHAPYVDVRGEKVIVVSQGAGGWFIEVLAAKDGKSLQRFTGGR